MSIVYIVLGNAEVYLLQDYILILKIHNDLQLIYFFYV